MNWLSAIFRRSGKPAANRKRPAPRGAAVSFPSSRYSEDRTVPACIASQGAVVAAAAELTTRPGAQLLERAAAATSTDNAIVAVVDRAGNILGVQRRGQRSRAITSDRRS